MIIHSEVRNIVFLPGIVMLMLLAACTTPSIPQGTGTPSGNGNAHPSSSHGDLSARRFPYTHAYTHAISDNYPYPDAHAFSTPYARPGRIVPHPGQGRTHRCNQR
jgi:hypothetical protein